MTVAGIRPYSLTAKDTGEVLTGVTMFCAYKDDKVEGYAFDKISLSAQKLRDCGYTPKLDDEINVTYNKYGRVEAVAVV